MAKINIRESLGRLDLLTDNKYDLRNTYDCSNISNDKKKKLAESISNNASAKQLHDILNEGNSASDLECTVKSQLKYAGFDDEHGYSFDFITNEDGSLEAQLSDGLDWKDYQLIKLIFKYSGIGVYQGKEHKDGDLLSIVFESEPLTEDTVKQNGKWVNKGKEGTHGKFNTKKAADAQRKAMFANGYKGESLEESLKESASDSDEYEREHILRLAKAVKEASKGADERKLSNLKKTAKKYLTNHKGTKHEKEYAVLQKAYDSLLDEDWEPDEWEETDFLDNDGKKVYINIIKEAEDIDDLKDIVHDLYWHDKGLFAMLRNFPKDKSFEWIQNRMIEVIKSTMNESLNEASYGGAYDIEDDMFWTKDDLIEFSDAVCEKLADKFGYQYDIADVGAENNNDMYITIMDTTHDIEADVSFRIKMSRIRAPRDLMKYLDTVVSQFVKKFEEEYQYYDFDESLKEESLTEDFSDMFEDDDDYEQTMVEIGMAILNDYTHGLTSTGHSWSLDVEEGYSDYDLEEIADAVLNPSLSGITTGGFNWSLDIDSYFDESLKEGFGEVSGDFAFARKNWNKLGTGVSFDDALEEYNKQFGEEYFYAKPIYVKSAWDKMVSMFTESLKEDYDDKKSLEFADFWIWAKTKDGKWKLYDAESEREDVSNSLRNAKADKRFVCAKVTKNGERPDGIKNYNVLTSESLKEAIEDEVDFDEFEETDFNDGEVEEGDTFIEDGREWSWIERIAGPIHLDFDNWAVWSARDWDYIQEKIRPILLNKEELTVETLTKIYDEAEVAYFVVDEDTGFIDWGPVESQTEAQDFLNGKVEDWENEDEYNESLKESKDLKEWWTVDLDYEDIGSYGYTYEADGEEVVDYLTEMLYENGEYPDFLEDKSDEEISAWLDDKENYPKFRDWVEENFDALFKKYEYETLEHFEDEATMKYFDEHEDDDLGYGSDNGSGMNDRDFL